LEQWQETWQAHWKRQGPPAYELTPAGRGAPADWEREFLATTRTPAKEKQRLDRILKEFSNGFDKLYNLGPAVTVFGSARFREGSAYYQLGVNVGRELARAGFAVITGGGPGMMEAANRGAKEAGGVSIGSMTHRQHDGEDHPATSLRRAMPPSGAALPKRRWRIGARRTPIWNRPSRSSNAIPRNGRHVPICRMPRRRWALAAWNWPMRP